MKQGAVRISIVLLAVNASAASAQTPSGGEFRVNTYTTGAQSTARVAMEPDGDFVVVWQGDLQDGSGLGVFGQRFAASGAPRGGEFRLNSYTTLLQAVPHVAVGSKGDFVVAWQSMQDGYPGTSIHGKRYDAAGDAVGAEFQVNTLTTGVQYRPHVGRASDGRFVVSWRCDVVDGSLAGIAARRFDASGNAIGAEFAVNTYTTGFQGASDVAADAPGDFVAVWEDTTGHDGSSFGIFGQRYDAAGNRLGNEFQVNSFTTGNQRIPSVSVSPAGGFVVVWRSTNMDGSDYAVAARRFDASGNAIGADFVVNTYTSGRQYGFFGQVAHDARGNFVVTWTSNGPAGYDVLAQRFSAAGARRGAELRANTYTTGNQRRSSVAGDAVGNFVVTWESAGQDGSGYGTFAQRFGGLGPAALAVDTPGNLVLEPGESVNVRPSWRNFSGSAQTVSGTLGDITGPAGATYAIIDGVGDYGTVADGATATCTDCYAVSVSNPATRPVTHWDASAVESLLPDTQGQQKQWLLHVGRSFTDVPTANPFYRFIETVLHHGVTGGCTATEYCPSDPALRNQMAVFVLKGKEGIDYVPPACTTAMFADVPASSPFCPWVEELARRGVVGGCGGGNYCPFTPVTREQMAVFMLRTLDPALTPPPCVAGSEQFADVPASSPFCRWIEELADRGVVTGCGGGNYCPSAPVTREQMALFIAVTFGLTLYGP